MAGSFPLDILLADLATMTMDEVAAIRSGAREVCYSGATRIKALSSETEFNREDAAQILRACNAIINPPDAAADDLLGDNYAAGSPSPNHAMRFNRSVLCGP